MSKENIIAENTIEALPTNDEEEKESIEIDDDEKNVENNNSISLK